MTRFRRLLPVVYWMAVGLFAAFAVVRVFGWEHTWILRVVMSFTPYITVASTIPLLVTVLARRWRAAVVAMLTTLSLVTVFVPRAVGEPDPGTGPRLRVMSSNMRIGGADPAEIVHLVRAHHIDLLAVEEYTPDAEDRLYAAGLTALLPFSATNPVPGAVGAAIYSRYPLSDERAVTVSGGFGQESATVRVPDALPLFFEAVHARSPNASATTTDWIRSLGQEPAATPHGPVRLLAGDFNATLDHAPLRSLLGTGYRDVASQLGDGLVATWPYDGRWVPPITIDHMFADPRIGAVKFGADRVTGTDHKAIYAELTLPPA